MVSKTQVVKTQTALAAALGVARSTVLDWMARGMPRNDDGTWFLPAVESWLAARAANDEGEDQESMAAWKLRKERAAALKAERELALVDSTLVPRTEMDRVQVGLVESFVSSLDALPSKVGPLLAGARSPAEMDQILRDHVRALRIQLAAKHSPKPAEVTT